MKFFYVLILFISVPFRNFSQNNDGWNIEMKPLEIAGLHYFSGISGFDSDEAVFLYGKEEKGGEYLQNLRIVPFSQDLQAIKTITLSTGGNTLLSHCSYLYSNKNGHYVSTYGASTGAPKPIDAEFESNMTLFKFDRVTGHLIKNVNYHWAPDSGYCFAPEYIRSDSGKRFMFVTTTLPKTNTITQATAKCRVFDSDLNFVSEQVITVPFAVDQYWFSDFHILDNGVIMVIGHSFREKLKKSQVFGLPELVPGQGDSIFTILVNSQTGESKTFPLDLKEYCFNSQKIFAGQTKNNRAYIGGCLYGIKKNGVPDFYNSAEGLFYFEFDIKNDRPRIETIREFFNLGMGGEYFDPSTVENLVLVDVVQGNSGEKWFIGEIWMFKTYSYYISKDIYIFKFDSLGKPNWYYQIPKFFKRGSLKSPGFYYYLNHTGLNFVYNVLPDSASNPGSSDPETLFLPDLSNGITFGNFLDAQFCMVTVPDSGEVTKTVYDKLPPGKCYFIPRFFARLPNNKLFFIAETDDMNLKAAIIAFP